MTKIIVQICGQYIPPESRKALRLQRWRGSSTILVRAVSSGDITVDAARELKELLHFNYLSHFFYQYRRIT